MAAASSLAAWNSSDSGASETHLETIEIDPQYAQTFGFSENDIVSASFPAARSWLSDPSHTR